MTIALSFSGNSNYENGPLGLGRIAVDARWNATHGDFAAARVESCADKSPKLIDRHALNNSSTDLSCIDRGIIAD